MGGTHSAIYVSDNRLFVIQNKKRMLLVSEKLCLINYFNDIGSGKWNEVNDWQMSTSTQQEWETQYSNQWTKTLKISIVRNVLEQRLTFASSSYPKLRIEKYKHLHWSKLSSVHRSINVAEFGCATVGMNTIKDCKTYLRVIYN